MPPKPAQKGLVPAQPPQRGRPARGGKKGRPEQKKLVVVREDEAPLEIYTRKTALQEAIDGLVSNNRLTENQKGVATVTLSLLWGEKPNLE